MVRERTTPFSVMSTSALSVMDQLTALGDRVDCPNSTEVHQLLESLGNAQLLLSQLINRGCAILYRQEKIDEHL